MLYCHVKKQEVFVKDFILFPFTLFIYPAEKEKKFSFKCFELTEYFLVHSKSFMNNEKFFRYNVTPTTRIKIFSLRAWYSIIGDRNIQWRIRLYFFSDSMDNWENDF